VSRMAAIGIRQEGARLAPFWPRLYAPSVRHITVCALEWESVPTLLVG
jgi:hypothetical protein